MRRSLPSVQRSRRDPAGERGEVGSCERRWACASAGAPVPCISSSGFSSSPSPSSPSAVSSPSSPRPRPPLASPPGVANTVAARSARTTRPRADFSCDAWRGCVELPAAAPESWLSSEWARCARVASSIRLRSASCSAAARARSRSRCQRSAASMRSAGGRGLGGGCQVSWSERHRRAYSRMSSCSAADRWAGRGIETKRHCEMERECEVVRKVSKQLSHQTSNVRSCPPDKCVAP